MCRIRVFIFGITLCTFCQILLAQNNHDLIDITTLDSTILVDIRYATADNFLGDTLYSANICLLRRPVAQKLVLVNQYLHRMGFGLKVWDGYRPLSVQKLMWTKVSKPGYVANPKYGSNHNRGTAVDVTLVDLDGNNLEMPTAFDDFSVKARSTYMNVPANALKHRTILQNAMKAFGFTTIKSEWWHFNDCDAKRYPVLDIPLEVFVNKSLGK